MSELEKRETQRLKRESEQQLAEAEKRGYNRAIEEAARCARRYTFISHGAVSTDPQEALIQAAEEIEAAILALKDEP